MIARRRRRRREFPARRHGQAEPRPGRAGRGVPAADRLLRSPGSASTARCTSRPPTTPSSRPIAGIMDGTGWPRRRPHPGRHLRLRHHRRDLRLLRSRHRSVRPRPHWARHDGRHRHARSTFSLMEQGLMDALGVHVRPHRIGNRHPSMAPFDTYQCKDQLIAICVGNDHLFAELAQVLGTPQSCPPTPCSTPTSSAATTRPTSSEAMEAVLKTDTAADLARSAWSRPASPAASSSTSTTPASSTRSRSAAWSRTSADPTSPAPR